MIRIKKLESVGKDVTISHFDLFLDVTKKGEEGYGRYLETGGVEGDKGVVRAWFPRVIGMESRTNPLDVILLHHYLERTGVEGGMGRETENGGGNLR